MYSPEINSQIRSDSNTPMFCLKYLRRVQDQNECHGYIITQHGFLPPAMCAVNYKKKKKEEEEKVHLLAHLSATATLPK